MTPQFTTPCYVRVDDPKKRKEVCEKLEQMGYLLLPPPCTEDYRFSIRLNFAYLYVESRCSVPIYDLSNHKPSCIPVIDCGTNIPLFLALAGMRSDTIINQWHISQTHMLFKKLKGEVITASKKRYISIGEMFMPLKQNLRFTWFDGNHNELFRRATAAEIIEHFKQKGETK